MNQTLGIIQYAAAGGATLYKRTITQDHTLIGSTDLTDYPMLVKLSDTTLKDQAHSGHVYRSDGYDITFYSDSGYTTLLSWEMRKYDPINGTVYAYVKIPTVSHTADTVIYMRYGDTAITTFQGGSTGAAWNSDFKSVIHGGDGSTLALSDSTSNSNGGTNSSATAASGKILGAWAVTGGSRITLANGIDTIVQSSASHTVEGWVYFTTQGATNYIWDGDTATSIGAFLNVTTNAEWGYTSYRVYNSIGTGTGAWYHIMMEKTGTGNSGNFYVNGVLKTVTSGTLGNPTAGASGMNYGNYHSSSVLCLDGKMEDWRISKVARGASYALAVYNNGNNSGNVGSAGFYTVGTETT